eukprot:TRINITY_DN41626_c0_g1_i1.p1 TRINITY_DN41626_c0_g1~~TRINITY_DN41626_c0_g1_i1.p1  ORF type:complete len:563 (-),score=87.98 TRINITY_DN41626_c0_g1_i1:87-1775(-)
MAPGGLAAHEPFAVPCRCLLPSDLAASAIDGLTDTVSLTAASDVPFLSDRVATIQRSAGGNCNSLEDSSSDDAYGACREVLCRLQAALGVSDDGAALFVILVPTTAAGTVVGAKGSRIRELIRTSGASVDVSREKLPGLDAQPVTITGSLDQIMVATRGVQEVLQESVDKGWLLPRHFALQANAASLSSSSVASCSRLGDQIDNHSMDDASVSSSACGRAASSSRGIAAGGTSSEHASVSMTTVPIVLLMSMEAAGRVIGRRGCTISELQRTTGTRISLLNDGAALPGMRCGDRLVEIAATGDGAVEAQEKGLCAVWEAASSEKDAAGATQSGVVSLLVPCNTVGFIIGKDGQAIREVMDRFAVDIVFAQDGPLIAGAQPASISGGAPRRCAEAALAVVRRIRKLRGQVAPSSARSSSVASTRLASVDGATAWAAGAAGFMGFANVCAGGDTASFAPAFTDVCTAEWTAKTPAELAVLAGLQASGAISCRLSMRVGEAVVQDLDIGEIERRSGARLEVVGDVASASSQHRFCYVTAVGTKLATSLASLYLQQRMSNFVSGGD